MSIKLTIQIERYAKIKNKKKKTFTLYMYITSLVLPTEKTVPTVWLLEESPKMRKKILI